MTRLIVEHQIAPGLQVRQYRLDNGLNLLALSDHSAPIVSFQTWFGVGSRHEQVGHTGMAHFFEHLMFTQTKSLPAGELDRLIEHVGGDSNAATWVDWTFYRTSVPSAELELAVRIESDRMQNLVLEPAIVEAEREVVINERIQRVVDSVDGFAGEELFRLAFQKHPYGWPTIGWMEDIRRLDLESIREFYRRYYAPNNATIVVVGDFEEPRLLELIESYYGAIPSQSIPQTMEVVEPAQHAERRAEYRKPTSVARLSLGYKAPGQLAAEWPIAHLAGALLSSGSSSRLHRRLVIEDELATSVHAEIMPFRDPCLFEIGCLATPGTELAELEDTIEEELAALREAPIADDELSKLRNIAETDFWGQLSTVDGKAEALGHYQCTVGDFRKLFDTADALARCSAADLQSFFQRYVVAENRSVVIVNPETA